MFQWTLGCSLPYIFFSCLTRCMLTSSLSALPPKLSKVTWHVWEEKHPSIISFTAWNDSSWGGIKQLKKISLDRRIRWFWHMKVDMGAIGSLTSTATLWCYRRSAAKHISDGGKISSRAEPDSASLHQSVPRGRWVLSRCQSLLAGQQHLVCFIIGTFAGSEIVFYFWTYNHGGTLY